MGDIVDAIVERDVTLFERAADAIATGAFDVVEATDVGADVAGTENASGRSGAGDTFVEAVEADVFDGVDGAPIDAGVVEGVDGAPIDAGLVEDVDGAPIDAGVVEDVDGAPIRFVAEPALNGRAVGVVAFAAAGVAVAAFAAAGVVAAFEVATFAVAAFGVAAFALAAFGLAVFALAAFAVAAFALAAFGLAVFAVAAFAVAVFAVATFADGDADAASSADSFSIAWRCISTMLGSFCGARCGLAARAAGGGGGGSGLALETTGSSARTSRGSIHMHVITDESSERSLRYISSSTSLAAAITSSLCHASSCHTPSGGGASRSLPAWL